LATTDLDASDFPSREKKLENYRYTLDCTFGQLQNARRDHGVYSKFQIVTIISAFFYATMGYRRLGKRVRWCYRAGRRPGDSGINNFGRSIVFQPPTEHFFTMILPLQY
jgi:hypothetical protein